MSASWDDLLTPPTIQANFSRDGGATFGVPVQVSTTSGDLEQPAVAFNRSYGNFLHAWTAHGALTANVYVGGIRPATLRSTPVWVSSAPVDFDVELFPASQDGWGFVVLLSGSTGFLPLPFGDGRDLGLAFDPIFTTGIGSLFPLLSGTLVLGAGHAPGFALPPLVPAGLTVFMAAVAFNPSSGVAFGALTDVGSRTF